MPHNQIDISPSTFFIPTDSEISTNTIVTKPRAKNLSWGFTPKDRSAFPTASYLWHTIFPGYGPAGHYFTDYSFLETLGLGWHYTLRQSYCAYSFYSILPSLSYRPLLWIVGYIKANFSYSVSLKSCKPFLELF